MADGKNGLRVLQLVSANNTAGAFGFSPRPQPKLIATTRPTARRSRSGKGLDRDRAVDESGNQMAVFGRRGGRPLNGEEQRKMYLRDGQVWTVSNEPPGPAAGASPTLDISRAPRPFAQPRSAASNHMPDAQAPLETRHDGSIVLDPPVELPEVLDALIVGGGPFGTAAAFRLKELGRNALVIDYDDLMKRIRDYAKDKQILPNYGGGDRMQFPKGGDLVAKLCSSRASTRTTCASSGSRSIARSGIPAQVGVEMTGLERDGELWQVVAWNHNLKQEQTFLKARHVVLAFGRGVPRRFDIPGNVDRPGVRADRGQRSTSASRCW